MNASADYLWHFREFSCSRWGIKAQNVAIPRQCSISMPPMRIVLFLLMNFSRCSRFRFTGLGNFLFFLSKYLRRRTKTSCTEHITTWLRRVKFKQKKGRDYVQSITNWKKRTNNSLNWCKFWFSARCSWSWAINFPSYRNPFFFFCYYA